MAAPFTTPFLVGARVRKAPQAGSELVLPNPSGNRGVYIVPWDGLRDLCQLSVFDTILCRQITRLTRIDPASIRRVALDVAIEGYAGHEAAAAAERALESDRAQRSLAQTLFVGELLRQVEPDSRKAMPLVDHTQLDPQARAVLHRIAASLGCPATHLENSIIVIGEAFAPVGVAGDDRAARVPKLIDLLKRTYLRLTRWLDEDTGNDIGGLGQAMAGMVKTTVLASQMVLAGTRTGVRDPVALLKRWMKQPNEVMAAAARCDWLLDGWERICLLWLAENTNPSRRGTLLEMVQLLPVLPAEAKTWPDMAIAHQALSQLYHVTSHSDSWRSGSAALGLIRRNELSRAQSL